MSQITFGSVCSGIEAASVAWNPLGWKAAWLAEIEPFPCAVLAHHYPDVPNLGDMTTIAPMVRDGFVSAPDVFCGGTPCQAFSVAGLRNSLDDARGNLSLIFCEIANEIDARRAADGLLPSVVFWENVPGVLSTKDNAFGCFLAGLAGEDDPLVPAGGKWTNAGCVLGPKRAVAWRVLDAQYFGVAQRRRRVFVVASAREGFDPTKVLFEFDGVRRDSAPRREAQKDLAGTIEASAGRSRGAGIQPAILAYGGGNCSGSIEVAACLTAKGQRIDFEVETFAVQAAVHAFDARQSDVIQYGDITGPLDTDGHTIGVMTPAVAFSCKDYGADAAVEIAPMMRAMGHSNSHANAGGQLAVCVTGEITHTLKAEGFDASEDGTGRGQPIVTAFKSGQSEAAGGVFLTEEFAPTLQAQNNGSTAVPAIQYGMAVRRLTPRECARLQGLPDGYLSQVIVRGKPAADGPMYKAFGNSWAIPNVRWIGARIDKALKEAA